MRSKIFTRTVGYWPLQEASGNALDYSGNENHATTTSVSSYGVNGPLGGTAMEFNGSSNYIGFADRAIPSGEKFYSMAGWVRPENSTAGEEHVVQMGDGGGGNPRSMLVWRGDHFSIYAQDSSSSINNDGWDSGRSTGEWYYACFVRSGSDFRIFVGLPDNKFISDEVINENIGDSTDGDTPTIGRADDDSSYFDGKIAHVRVWDYPLPEAAIRALYNASRGGFSESDSRTL